MVWFQTFCSLRAVFWNQALIFPRWPGLGNVVLQANTPVVDGGFMHMEMCQKKFWNLKSLILPVRMNNAVSVLREKQLCH